MSKIVLDEITSGYQLSKVNKNFQRIEDELNNKVLYRNAPDGEINTVEKDIDLNGKKLYNVGDIQFQGFDSLEDLLERTTTAAEESEASKDAAEVAAENAAISAAAASTYSGSAVVRTFSGDGSTVAFNLTASPLTKENTQVYIGSVYQRKSTYSVTDNILTFNTAPPVGTNNIEVVIFESVFVPQAGYTIPVVYTSGIVLSQYNQLVEYNSEFYKLKAGQAPYTTTGTWETDSAKLVAVGDAALRQELTANANDFSLLPEIANYAALQAYIGDVTAYYVRGVANNFDGGSGIFRVDAADTTTADNGGTTLVDASGRRWKRECSGAVNVAWFGAVGDGVADDTAAIHAAIDAAKAANGAVYFPAGKYRVTSGYTHSTNNSVSLVGENLDYYASTAANSDGSCVVLDSTDPNSFFFHQSAGSNLNVSNMQFACEQYVIDRKFFVQSASSVRHIFQNVHFSAVERPIVYLTGTYFQLSSYTNVRFTNSGSFHSTAGSLIGTFMKIVNVDVEGTIPANSEKIICNLAGIRQIHGSNFLIEPATPSSGWTALFLRNSYDPAWVRFPDATFHGFWIEVTGSGLTNSVLQERGRTLFIAPVFNNGALAQFRINEDGATEIRDTSFSGTSDPLQNYFTLSTAAQVKLTNCNYRNAGNTITDPRYTFDSCSNVLSGGAGTESLAISHNNQAPQLLWAFDGGYPDPGRVLVQTFSGTTFTPTANAAFGRAIQVTPSAGVINLQFQGLTRGDFPVGAQFFVVLRATMPTLSSGITAVNMIVNGSIVANSANYTSGQDIRLVFPIATPSSNPTNVGININTETATGNLLIYQLELWIGKSLPNVTMPSFPQNVITFAAAPPAAGEWARGDIIWNNTPSAGGPTGWVCTTGGTPGTWRAMANLAA